MLTIEILCSTWEINLAFPSAHVLFSLARYCTVHDIIILDELKFFMYCRLLQDNPDLYQLYKDLVVGDIITAEEFWANRSNGQVTDFVWITKTLIYVIYKFFYLVNFLLLPITQ